MITGVITVPNNLNTFIVNVSFSNLGGVYLSTPSFGFGFLGPVTNIDSSIDNCSTIDITWTAPTVDPRVSILYYNLSIYDNVTGQFLRSVSVYDTSYQFPDEELFRHRYTYVITGVNELGEGISNNGTFSYQRVPRSVEEGASDILMITFNETSAAVYYNITITLECTGESPKNVTVTIECNGTGVLYNDATLVEYAKRPMDITGSVPVPLYQQCNISIVFSNEAGSSEPFILAFDTTPIINTPSPTGTSSPDLIFALVIIGATVGGIAVLLIIILVMIICYRRKGRAGATGGDSTTPPPEKADTTGKGSACDETDEKETKEDTYEKKMKEDTYEKKMKEESVL
ncbi:PREDICTED: uncharacterized protein LOC109586778 [Amphimedon queenslandica]|nr:PREDICTED: uncharacterized protein LOC109586778 [Amphimedon queenslandica]|eukprot:XP_019858545.1 PREDICTED: uncharacterized protein LOC109586778 [Amphimedon queenslandica]